MEASFSSTSSEVSVASATQASKTYSLFSSSSQSASIKLYRDNYLVWTSVIFPLIKGNHLQSHISKIGQVPSCEILSEKDIVRNHYSWVGCETP
ncbi:uncharacterized protein G2W53_004664 [Senna tora]|uniref:Uncharacterized protein n=1 Tax=Senna tora TaxID=362788 RepID=A0A835CGN1_9FABA|nr:uncharacterized protein G2W53_004664 [Senna tora]